MSTIRRHGVAFHLIPTPGSDLWLEVIREADGVVLVSTAFDGDSDDLAPAVDAWFEDLALKTISKIDIPTCRSCNSRRREVERDEDYRIQPGFLTEWMFELCHPCATQFEHANPWLRGLLLERFFPDRDDW